MTRPSASVIAAALVVLAGFAGLVRGALPRAGDSSATGQPVVTASGADPIVVGGAYVRQPANGVNVAAYFTVYNTTGHADRLVSVNSGAGAQTTLHLEDASGGMSMDTGGLTIPAHGSAALAPGKGHAMIEKLYGPVLAGQTVNLQLTFAQSGEVLVTAPVISLTAPAPNTTGVPK